MFLFLHRIKFNKKIFLFFSFLLLFFFAQTAFAAELRLSPSTGSYNVGNTIKVRIVLSTPSQSANAVSGSLKFSKNLLTLTSVSKSGSLISLWAKDPIYSNVNGTVSMEGIILNGYSGSNGTILTLSFRAKATGTANVEFSSSSVLANDGQGTNILTSIGQANFTINKATAKTTTVKKTTKIVPNIKLQELKKKDKIDSYARFLITSVGKKSKFLYIVEIDDVIYPWKDQESEIFETPALLKGIHTLKVSMDTIDNDTMSDDISFIIDAILIPTLTEYSENIREKEYIVVKGLADSNVDIIINSTITLNNRNQYLKEETIIRSDEKGLFTYVSGKTSSGLYEITAYSRTQNGAESKKSLPIQINVLSGSVLANVTNTLSVLIPIVALIILLIVLSIWGWYKVLHYKANMHKKLLHTRSLVNKSFDILDDDIEEQIKILKKIKGLHPLTSNERIFINQFKKDIESAEKIIIDEIKKSEK